MQYAIGRLLIDTSLSQNFRFDPKIVSLHALQKNLKKLIYYLL